MLRTQVLRAYRSELVPAAPLKWRKYLALVDFGFQSADELAADIRRYQINNVRRLASDLRSDIQDDVRRAI